MVVLAAPRGRARVAHPQRRVRRSDRTMCIWLASCVASVSADVVALAALVASAAASPRAAAPSMDLVLLFGILVVLGFSVLAVLMLLSMET